MLDEKNPLGSTHNLPVIGSGLNGRCRGKDIPLFTMQAKRRAFCFPLLFVSACTGAYAQIDRAEINGTVLDASGAAIADAVVTFGK